MRKTLIILTCLVAVYLYGVYSATRELFPYPQLRSVKNSMKSTQGLWEKKDDHSISTKKQIDCKTVSRGGKTMTALLIGQSNAANSGDTLYRPRGAVYEFYRGKCYGSFDPVLGATGKGGSVWTRLADKLISAGVYNSVVFINVAVKGSEIKRWASGGDLYPRIDRAISGSKEASLRITHVLFHQGETDAYLKTGKEQYKESFLDMLGAIRGAGVNAPVYVSTASRSMNRVSKDIREAQAELALANKKGPDTDKLNLLDDRYDGVHFSAKGMEKFAQLWFEVLSKEK